MEFVDYNEFGQTDKSYFSFSEVDEKTGWSGIGFMKVIMLLAIASFSFNSEATSTFDQFNIGSKLNERVRSNNIVYSEKDLKGVKSPILILSSKLQHEFGFKKAQWASILNVERKTLYNWEEKPDSTPHAKVMINLEVLKHFSEEIDKGHAPFISKMTFGKGRKDEFTQAFTRQPLSIESMVSAYEKYYTEIDGFYKRQLLS
ncbi:TPA: hypothetical protein QHK14_003563 [Klebsiella pneumoniae]|uniref:hypothetical protein n=1 Tax=Klebsiella pneumoniae TaxID=573 RepID=UPI000C79DBAF|nr:hypothetical protein [Klebsiella pneumoniae]HBX3912988.1 hypothetical protein [Klebsiella pneumoniae subsp. pneumoniae]ELQ4519198.1 hypothetical protein [Klebsiella pneumoniae]MBC4547109.1 hypothetical protein [Klebsiella pneumoniae]MBG1739515.1 hypothetical protein [Klebsiella pneumoniae]MCP5903503.1 hypothetical protein [Klebsiella pneumoniae]